MIIWLASFPRSGNTFMRAALHAALGCDTYSIYNDTNDIAKDKKLSDIIGHCTLNNRSLSKMALDKKLYFIKTHHIPDSFFDNSKIIYLFRDGREASLSLANYTSEFKGPSLSFTDIVNGKYFFGSWSQHISSWMKLSDTYSGNFLSIKFEDLTASPHSILKKTLSFLELGNKHAKIPTFKQLRKINPSFFPSGKTDSWKKIISQDDHIYFWLTSYHQMEQCGYRNEMPLIVKNNDFIHIINGIEKHYKPPIQPFEINNYVEEKKELLQKNETLQFENSELAEQINALTSEKATLTQRVVDLEDDKKDLKGLVETLNDEKTALTQRVVDLEDDKKNLKGLVETLNDEKTTLTQRVVDLEDDKKDLKGLVETLNDEKTTLTQRVVDLEDDKKEIKTKTVNLEKQQHQLMKEKLNLWDQINSLKSDQINIEEKLLDANRQSSLLRNTLKEKENNLKLLLERYHENQEASQRKCNQLKEKLIHITNTSDQYKENFEDQKRLNEIIKCTLEQERADTPLSRIAKRLLFFQDYFATTIIPTPKLRKDDVVCSGLEDSFKDTKTDIDKEDSLSDSYPLADREKNNSITRPIAVNTPPNIPSYLAETTPDILGKDWKEIDNIIQKEFTGHIELITDLEVALTEGRQLPRHTWAAMAHVPMQLPLWLKETKEYKSLTSAFISSKEWRLAKENCQTIFTFSKEHAKVLEAQTGIKTHALRRPVPKVIENWSWEKFEGNKEKQIIQSGWWLLRIHAIHLLPASNYKKSWLRKPEQMLNGVFSAERDLLKTRAMFFNYMDHTVIVSENLSSDEYEKQLCSNIAFAHYYDTCSPDFLLQCIAHNTPILINALPAVREYLGDNYPFYYYFYEDAVEKASNFDLVLKTHNYLKNLSNQSRNTSELFYEKIRKALSEK